MRAMPIAWLCILALSGAAGAQPTDDPPPEDPPPEETDNEQPTPDVAPAEPAPAPTPAPAPAPAPAVPTPEQAARAATPAPKPAKPRQSNRPQSRRYFVKGELTTFAGARPRTQRQFFGAAAGVEAIPNDPNALLNTFYLTVEPQLDLKLGKTKNWKIGLGVPLRFLLADLRGSFENCLQPARDALAMGGTQTDAQAAAGACLIEEEKDSIVENFGKLRKQDWDETSDFAKVIRYIHAGGDEEKFFLDISRISSQSVGHGTVVRRYNPNLDFNTTRVGMTLDAYHKFVGFESMVNDIVDPDVMSILGFVRPLQPVAPDNVLLSRLSFGAQISVGRNMPTRLAYEQGIFDPSFNLPVPLADSNLDLVKEQKENVTIIGFDVETKILRTQTSDIKVYFDAQQMLDRGRGYTLGTLMRFSFGQPARIAIRVRGEAHYHDPDYLPSFFDTFHEIHKLQYMPAAYVSTQGLTYFPTKLAYLDANAGGKRRMGGYLSATFSLLGKLNVGLAIKHSVGVGNPLMNGFTGPRFDDLTECPWTAPNVLDCSGTPQLTVGNPGYTSIRMHVEVPFKKYLQTYAIYEIFKTPLSGEKIDLFSLDGDNEIFHSGLRLQILPVLFIQAQLQRYYFFQRVRNIKLNVTPKVFEQDGNYHSEWTMAVQLFTGYEY